MERDKYLKEVELTLAEIVREEDSVEIIKQCLENRENENPDFQVSRLSLFSIPSLGEGGRVWRGQPDTPPSLRSSLRYP